MPSPIQDTSIKIVWENNPDTPITSSTLSKGLDYLATYQDYTFVSGQHREGTIFMPDPADTKRLIMKRGTIIQIVNEAVDSSEKPIIPVNSQYRAFDIGLEDLYIRIQDMDNEVTNPVGNWGVNIDWYVYMCDRDDTTLFNKGSSDEYGGGGQILASKHVDYPVGQVPGRNPPLVSSAGQSPFYSDKDTRLIGGFKSDVNGNILPLTVWDISHKVYALKIKPRQIWVLDEYTAGGDGRFIYRLLNLSDIDTTLAAPNLFYNDVTIRGNEVISNRTTPYATFASFNSDIARATINGDLYVTGTNTIVTGTNTIVTSSTEIQLNSTTKIDLNGGEIDLVAGTAKTMSLSSPVSIGITSPAINLTGSTVINGATSHWTLTDGSIDSFSVDSTGGMDLNLHNGFTVDELDSASYLHLTPAGAVDLYSGSGQTLTINSVSTLDMNSVAATLDASGGFSIDGTGAVSNLTSTGQKLTVSTVTAGALEITSAATLDMNSVAATLDASGGFSIDGTGAVSNLSSTTADLTISTLTSGNLYITSVGSLNTTAASLSETIGGTTTIITTTGETSVTLPATKNLSFTTQTTGAISLTSDYSISLQDTYSTPSFIKLYDVSGQKKIALQTIGNALDAISLGAGPGGVSLTGSQIQLIQSGGSSLTLTSSSVAIKAAATTFVNIVGDLRVRNDTDAATFFYVDNSNGNTTAYGTLTTNSTLTTTGNVNNNYSPDFRITNTNTSKSKSLRVNNAGTLEFVNSAYSTVIATLDDVGVLTTTGFSTTGTTNVGALNIGASSSGNFTPSATVSTYTPSPPATYNGIVLNGHFAAYKIWNAVYNDLAEYFLSKDKEIPGRVYVLYRDANVMLSNSRADTKAIGVCSDTAAYLMKSEYQAIGGVPLALAGTVKVCVKSLVKEGAILVSDKEGYATRARWFEKIFKRDAILGKALEASKDKNEKRILMLISR